MENTTSVDYRHVKKLFRKFNNKSIDCYYDLYVWSNTLLAAAVFENFRNKCIELYELGPDNFLFAPGLAWQTCLKNKNIKLELLTNFIMNGEKVTRGGICDATHRSLEANNKYTEN